MSDLRVVQMNTDLKAEKAWLIARIVLLAYQLVESPDNDYLAQDFYPKARYAIDAESFDSLAQALEELKLLEVQGIK